MRREAIHPGEFCPGCGEVVYCRPCPRDHVPAVPPAPRLRKPVYERDEEASVLASHDHEQAAVQGLRARIGDRRVLELFEAGIDVYERGLGTDQRGRPTKKLHKWHQLRAAWLDGLPELDAVDAHALVRLLLPTELRWEWARRWLRLESPAIAQDAV
jgi:hypothetical protein